MNTNCTQVGAFVITLTFRGYQERLEVRLSFRRMIRIEEHYCVDEELGHLYKIMASYRDIGKILEFSTNVL